MLYTPLLPGAASGSLEPATWSMPAARGADLGGHRLARVTGADPRPQLAVRTVEGETRCSLRPADRGARVDLAGAARSGLAEHAIGFKTLAEAIALRNCAIQHLEIAEALDDPEERRSLPDLRLRRRRLRRAGGHRRASGLRRRCDRALPALPDDGARFVLVEARDRVMHEILRRWRSSPPASCAGGHGDPHWNRLERGGREPCAPLHGRGDSGADGRAGRRAWRRRRVARLGLPLVADGRIEVDAYARVHGCENVWADRRLRGVPDPARRGKQTCPPDRPTRASPGKAGCRQRGAGLWPTRRRGSSATGRSACSWTWGSTRRSRRCSGFASAACRRGLPRTYHLAMMPGIGAAAAAHGGLDRGAVLRPRVVRAWASSVIYLSLGEPTPIGEGRAGSRVGQADGLTLPRGLPNPICVPPSRSTSGRFTTRRAGMGVGFRGAEPQRQRGPRTSGSAGATCWSSWPPFPAAVLDLRGRRAEWSATASVCEWGQMEELTELMVLSGHHRRRRRAGAAPALLAGATPHPISAGSWSTVGVRRRPHAETRSSASCP